MRDGLAYLTELTWAFEGARALHVATRLGVFTLLDVHPMTAKQLAKRTGTDEDMLERLLIACCAMGLLSRQERDTYRNTEIADQYLVRGRPLFQGDVIAFSATAWSIWDKLEDTVRHGRHARPPPVSEAAPRQRRDFSLAMHNMTMAGRGDLFTDHIDLRGRRHLFDVGGGPGTYSILACKKNPELTATVFDLPNTVQLAKEMIANEGLQDRIHTQAGNWDTEEFGDGNDVVLFSNVLHGPSSNARMKLEKAFRSMVPGGLLVTHDFVLDEEKTGPLVPALFNLWASGAYSSRELIEEMRDVGFADPSIRVVDKALGSTWITAIRPG